jgi:2-amino-4-hydroxy-6-hydroxymethyldihydropteridine diphosphokinase
VETEPVGVVDGGKFLNLVLCLHCTDGASILKQRFNQLEIDLGRDRSDPASRQKSRPIDLDILFALPTGHTAVNRDLLPSEPYVRPMLLELLTYLLIEAQVDMPLLPPGAAVSVGGVFVGDQPATICRDAKSNRIMHEVLQHDHL